MSEKAARNKNKQKPRDFSTRRRSQRHWRGGSHHVGKSGFSRMCAGKKTGRRSRQSTKKAPTRAGRAAQACLQSSHRMGFT